MPAFITQLDWATIIGELLGRGLRIALIAALAYGLYSTMKRVTPHLVAVLIARVQEEEFREEYAKRIETLSRVATGTAAVILLIIASFTILSELGVNIAPVLTGVGIAGVAIGFGAQSLVKDIIGGLLIILENQYRRGDVVKIAGVAGLVEDVNLRRTVLRDLDGVVHNIPNGEVTISSNFTRLWSRVNLDVTVAYEEDLDRVTEVINRVGKELAEDEYWGPMIMEPPQVLRVEEFRDSGIAIKILGTTRPIKQWDVMGELRKRLKKAFDREGIEIPFPHRVVYHRYEGGPSQPSEG